MRRNYLSWSSVNMKLPQLSAPTILTANWCFTSHHLLLMVETRFAKTIGAESQWTEGVRQDTQLALQPIKPFTLIERAVRIECVFTRLVIKTTDCLIKAACSAVKVNYWWDNGIYGGLLIMDRLHLWVRLIGLLFVHVSMKPPCWSDFDCRNLWRSELLKATLCPAARRLSNNRVTQ